jgi:2-polyprenyl-6-methoxyphenol hydroxylase-like FAD-dependent oxidoreductase
MAPLLGKTMMSVNVDNHTHAIVIGGSIAGLTAARVLTQYFDRVTVVERDRYPEDPVARQGVSQSHQVHVLLSQGQRILEQLFPGLKDELADKGAASIDWIADYSLCLQGRWTPRFKSEIVSCACTRNLLEATIRKRLADDPKVEFKEASLITGLLATTDNTAVTGVQIRSNGITEKLPAQLVVDASGRDSKAPQWLQSLGYEMPQETKVNSFLGYASRSYQSLSQSHVDYKVLNLIAKAPDSRRGGVLYQVENGQWMALIAGVGRDYPPSDEAGFLNFARSLSSPEIYEAIINADPISPIYSYQRTENRMRHYEKLSRLPENFVVLGDAVCAFNPVYGQGMTVAALGALTLDKCLRNCTSADQGSYIGLAQEFSKKLAKVNSVPWMMATSDDFRWSTTEGGKPDLITRLMHKYIDRVIWLAGENPHVYKVFTEVSHLLKPPTTLFYPGILARVLKLIIMGTNTPHVQ